MRFRQADCTKARFYLVPHIAQQTNRRHCLRFVATAATCVDSLSWPPDGSTTVGSGRTNNLAGRCCMGRNVLQHGRTRVVRRRSASSRTRVPPCPHRHLPTPSPVWLPAPRWRSCGIRIRAWRHRSRSAASRAARMGRRPQEPVPTRDGTGIRQDRLHSGWPGNPGLTLKCITPEPTGAHSTHWSAQCGFGTVFKESASLTARYRVCDLSPQPLSTTEPRTRASQHPAVGRGCRR